MMSRIKGRDTKPEMALRRVLHAMGFRYRAHARLPGRPDIVLPKYKAAIMVHGCFWHRHPGCPMATTPGSNAAFWQDKFDATVRRDARKNSELAELGWRVAVVWECGLEGQKLARTAQQVARWIKSTRRFLET